VTGPLAGLHFVEMAGLGPAPFAAMVLADLGASGVRIESPRPSLVGGDPRVDITRRGRRILRADVRDDGQRAQVLDAIDDADLLIEGFRPGVMERLGLGPDLVMERNPRLVYGRITGWGQEGPWAHRAGHDINYIAVAGVLAHLGRRGQPPTPPLNIIGDYAGGAMLLLTGVLAALWEARGSGRGQVVDAAMVDGAALMMSLMRSLAASGGWSPERGANLLDTGAPFYDVYRTADGRWLAVGCLEPRFFAEFAGVIGLPDGYLDRQYDATCWEQLREDIATRLAERTCQAWLAEFGDGDSCVAPVLSMDEAPTHEHMSARGTFIELNGLVQPAPAPRFSRTPLGPPGAIE
jgi:alpha-methylacyl-CoA racemase